MIEFKKITKKYSEQYVLKDFSYKFPDCGLVVLFGRSGSGKTTLLNIIEGITPFDDGVISAFGETYQKQVSFQDAKRYCSYMMQNVFLIDYLSIYDNLRLSGETDDKIEREAKFFGINDLLEKFPNNLSGGERQRVFLLQGYLQNKQVFLLDEPTASLDKVNRDIILDFIKKISEKKLIICATHDKEFLKYADVIIRLSDNSYEFEEVLSSKKNENIKETCEGRIRPPLWQFFKKQMKYKNREKKSNIQFGIVICLVLVAVFLSDFYQNKVDANAKYLYHINQIVITTQGVNEPLLKIIEDNSHVKDCVLNYDLNVPDGRQSVDDVFSNVEYATDLKTIPTKESFSLSDKIFCGNYAESADQIMLSYNMAVSLGNPEHLIGETYSIELYDGLKTFEIAGVFEDFNSYDEQYLIASRIDYSDVYEKKEIYVSSNYTDKYIYKPYFMPVEGSRTYVVYFDNYNNLKLFYDKYCDAFANTTFEIVLDGKINMLFESLFVIVFPLCIIILISAILFYFQTKEITIMHNKHLLSVYNYLGYSKKKILSCFLLLHFIQLLKTFVASSIVTIILTLFINVLNIKVLRIFPYLIFTYNLTLLITVFLILVFFSMVILCKIFKKSDVGSWYKVFLKNRDLV